MPHAIPFKLDNDDDSVSVISDRLTCKEVGADNPSVNPHSARALVKKTQEPGIKLQKADFFRNDTWTSPQKNSEDAPKIPLVHFF